MYVCECVCSVHVNLSGVFPLILLSGAVSETIAGGLIEKHAGSGRPSLIFTPTPHVDDPSRPCVYDLHRTRIGLRSCVYVIFCINTITTIIRSSLVLTQKRMPFDGIVCRLD